jgi:hypothetical protein
MTFREGGENKLKKILTLCLALMLALSVTGSAFAGFRPCKHKKEKETKSSSFRQRTTIINRSEAKTGNVVAIGNISATFVGGSSRSRADRCCRFGSDRDNQVSVENNGSAVAYSGAANSENVVENNICTDVTK